MSQPNKPDLPDPARQAKERRLAKHFTDKVKGKPWEIFATRIIDRIISNISDTDLDNKIRDLKL